LDELQIDSQALRGNPLGDASLRPLWVYVPPGYDDEPERRYPTVFAIQGYTGQIDMWRNREVLRPTYIEALDAMFAAEEAPPCIVAFVDCWTSVGGSQFLDSPATGDLHLPLWRGVPSSTRYRTLAGRDNQDQVSQAVGALGRAMLV
jgi:hypothetical protein